MRYFVDDTFAGRTVLIDTVKNYYPAAHEICALANAAEAARVFKAATVAIDTHDDWCLMCRKGKCYARDALTRSQLDARRALFAALEVKP